MRSVAFPFLPLENTNTMFEYNENSTFSHLNEWSGYIPMQYRSRILFFSFIFQLRCFPNLAHSGHRQGLQRSFDFWRFPRHSKASSLAKEKRTQASTTFKDHFGLKVSPTLVLSATLFFLRVSSFFCPFHSRCSPASFAFHSPSESLSRDELLAADRTHSFDSLMEKGNKQKRQAKTEPWTKVPLADVSRMAIGRYLH